MRYPILLSTCALLLCTALACGDSKTATPPRKRSIQECQPQVVEAGRQAARQALQYEPESAERIDAMLRIHAAEHRLRSHGMDESADAFALGADAVLDSAGIGV